MKRILSLILALLLCCGFIVSCEKEESPLESESSSSSSDMPSSSSEPSSSEKPSSNTGLTSNKNEKYYEVVYASPRSIQNDTDYANKIFLLKNEDELKRSISLDKLNGKYVTEIFDDNYVCKIHITFNEDLAPKHIKGVYGFDLDNKSINVDLDCGNEFLGQRTTPYEIYIILPKGLWAKNEGEFQLMVNYNEE